MAGGTKLGAAPIAAAGDAIAARAVAPIPIALAIEGAPAVIAPNSARSTCNI